MTHQMMRGWLKSRMHCDFDLPVYVSDVCDFQSIIYCTLLRIFPWPLYSLSCRVMQPVYEAVEALILELTRS